MNKVEQRIKIGIQKGGRLTEGSQDLLRSSGLNFEFKGKQLIAPVSNFPADILLLKNSEILTFVEEGSIELGIVGEDSVEENKPNVKILNRLGFGKCRLTVGIPQSGKIIDLAQLQGTIIATSLTRITYDRLAELGIDVQTKKQNGSVEIAPILYPNVTAIADLTESEETMKQNGIRPIKNLQEFEALLIANPNALNQKGSRRIIDQLNFRVQRVLKGTETCFNQVENDTLKEGL